MKMQTISSILVMLPVAVLWDIASLPDLFNHGLVFSMLNFKTEISLKLSSLTMIVVHVADRLKGSPFSFQCPALEHFNSNVKESKLEQPWTNWACVARIWLPLAREELRKPDLV